MDGIVGTGESILGVWLLSFNFIRWNNTINATQQVQLVKENSNTTIFDTNDDIDQVSGSVPVTFTNSTDHIQVEFPGANTNHRWNTTIFSFTRIA